MEKTQVKFIKALYPYNEGDIGELNQTQLDMWLPLWYVEVVGAKKENKSMDAKAKITKSK